MLDWFVVPTSFFPQASNYCMLGSYRYIVARWIRKAHVALLTPHPPSGEGFGGRILDSEMCIHRYVENPTSQSNRSSLTEMWWMNDYIFRWNLSHLIWSPNLWLRKRCTWQIKQQAWVESQVARRRRVNRWNRNHTLKLGLPTSHLNWNAFLYFLLHRWGFVRRATGSSQVKLWKLEIEASEAVGFLYFIGSLHPPKYGWWCR